MFTNAAPTLGTIDQLSFAHQVQPLAKDYEYDPTGQWRYAIDTNTLAFVNTNAAIPSPVFDSARSPVYLTATACPINGWTTNAGGSSNSGFADLPPQSPVACAGAQVQVKLWPYGSAKLRIGEIPTFTPTTPPTGGICSGIAAWNSGVAYNGGASVTYGKYLRLLATDPKIHRYFTQVDTFGPTPGGLRLTLPEAPLGLSPIPYRTAPILTHHFSSVWIDKGAC